MILLSLIPGVSGIPGIPAVPALPTAASLKSKLPLPPDHPQAIFSLSVDGQDITVDISKRLSTLTLTDNRGFEADMLEIALDDSDGKLALPPRGALINFSLGWKATGLIDKGSYTVDEITHAGAPDILTLHARSAELGGGLTALRERSWHAVVLKDIINTIAAENELEPMISATLSGQFVEHIDQTHESSAAFLTRLASLFDAIAAVKKGKLLFVCAGAGTSASGKPLPAVTITRQSGDGHHFSIADRDSYTHVKALYHDTGANTQGEVIWSKAEDAAESGRAAQAVTAPVGNYQTLTRTYKSRSAALREARKAWALIAKSKAQLAKYIGVKAAYHDLNLKTEAVISYGAADVIAGQQKAANLAQKDNAKNTPPKVAFEPDAENIKVMRHKYASQESARRAARAEWRRLQRGMANFSITLAHGRPDLIPEQSATVQGFKREIDSTDWTIIKATHSLSDGGLTTKLDFEIRATEIPG